MLKKHFSCQEGAEPQLVVDCARDPVTAAQRAEVTAAEELPSHTCVTTLTKLSG